MMRERNTIDMMMIDDDDDSALPLEWFRTRVQPLPSSFHRTSIPSPASIEHSPGRLAAYFCNPVVFMCAFLRGGTTASSTLWCVEVDNSVDKCSPAASCDCP